MILRFESPNEAALANAPSGEFPANTWQVFDSTYWKLRGLRAGNFRRTASGQSPEEPALAGRFGDSYQRHRSSVHRWLIRKPKSNLCAACLITIGPEHNRATQF